MKLITACSFCTMFERLQLPWLGPILLMVTGFIAILSLFVWPLLFIWPIMVLIGLGVMAGYGACNECHIST